MEIACQFTCYIIRDDILSNINNNFSNDSPPPLLVAIQFHWSYGAVQLLLHGANPASQWNKKLVFTPLKFTQTLEF